MDPNIQETAIENVIPLIQFTHKSVQLEGLVALRLLLSVTDNRKSSNDPFLTLQLESSNSKGH